jgi:hypothetical protein
VRIAGSISKAAQKTADDVSRFPDGGWPVFFVARKLAGRNPLRVGQLWPDQDRRTIRAYSESYGVPDDKRPWDQLPFVRTLVVRDAGVAQQVIAAGLSYEQAVAFVADLEKET